MTEPEFLKGKRRKKGADKSVLAMKPGEVVISRRLYRSGQSEYLINGRVARLRDIQEMFMGVGLGPDSYAIIEQGRIGLILSSKPHERRAIIEEAAGVTKFKTKKRLAEAKLESSKVNLSRVNDIVVEVEKQLGSLKRQAAKARRHSEIRDQMRGIVRQMLAGKARELDGEAERVARRLEELSASETQHAQAIQTTRRRAGPSQSTHLRTRRGNTAEPESSESDCAGGRSQREPHRLQSPARGRTGRPRGAGGHRNRTSDGAGRRVGIAKRRATAAVVLLREESGVLTARVAELAVTAESRAAQIRESEGRIDALRQSATEAGESLLRVHGEQKQAEEALVHQSAGLRKLESNEAQLLESSIKIRDGAERAALEWEATNGQLGALNQKTAALQTRIAALREERETATKQAEALRDSLAGMRARHATLTQVLNDRSYTADAVQKLFAANERGGGPRLSRGWSLGGLR